MILLIHQDLFAILQVRAPVTIVSLLHNLKERPWLTLGSIPADLGHCSISSTSEHQYVVERMLWHDKLPECMHNDQDPWLCIAHIGRRKWVANTKYPITGGVHRAALPSEGGVNMNASEARMIHFHNALNPYQARCNIQVEDMDNNSLAHLERDNAIALKFVQAKLFPIIPKEKRS